MPDTLHARLRAAVEERLAVARAALDSAPDWSTVGIVAVDAHGGVPFASRSALAAHIAANDPAATIRRCEALLRVVGRHAPKAELRIVDLEGTQALAEKVLTSLDDSDGQTIDIHAAAVVAARTLNLLAEVERLRELIEPPRVLRDLAAGEGIEL